MPGLQTTVTEEELIREEEQLVSQLLDRAFSKLSGVNNASDAHVRDILPNEDFDQDDGDNDNGWDGNDRLWEQTGLTADQLNQVYEIDSTGNAEDKVIGIYAISNIAADPSTTEIVLEDGTGNRFERLMVQESYTDGEENYALLRNPIIINPGKDAVIYQWPDRDGDDNVIYHGAVVESAGDTLGTRSQTESAPQGTARQPTRR